MVLSPGHVCGQASPSAGDGIDTLYLYLHRVKLPPTNPVECPFDREAPWTLLGNGASLARYATVPARYAHTQMYVVGTTTKRPDPKSSSAMTIFHAIFTSARAAGLVRMHGHSNANAWQCSRGPPNAAGFSRRGISAGQAALAAQPAANGR